MTTNSENVLVALTGAVLYAPSGTTLPTDTSTVWGATFADLGYLSEDGVSEAYEDETTDIKAWQRGDTVRSLITSSSMSFAFTMIETTAKGLELYHGAEVSGFHASGHGPASISIAGAPNGRYAFGFDVVDGDKDIRIVVPNGSVSERGEITYLNNDAIGYPVTVKANPGPSGITAIKYFSDLDGLPVTDPEA